jgi:hypothetical protein
MQTFSARVVKYLGISIVFLFVEDILALFLQPPVLL